MQVWCNLCKKKKSIGRNNVTKITMGFWDKYRVYICRDCIKEIIIKELKKLSKWQIVKTKEEI